MARDFPYNDYPYNGYPYQNAPSNSYPYADDGEERNTKKGRGAANTGSGIPFAGGILGTIVGLLWLAYWIIFHTLRLLFKLLDFTRRRIKSSHQ